MKSSIKIVQIVGENKVEVSNEVLPFKDGSNRDAVEKKLAELYGAGFLLQNGEIIVDKNLPGGEYEYQLITQPSSQQGK
jgi:hypothetical protein